MNDEQFKKFDAYSTKIILILFYPIFLVFYIIEQLYNNFKEFNKYFYKEILKKEIKK